MSNHTEVIAYVGLALSAAAGLCALAGWAWNLPNGSKRYRWRFAAWCFAFAVFGWWAADAHGWRMWADFLCAAIAFMRASDWWRRLELVRAAERGEPLNATQVAYVAKLKAKRDRYSRWSS